MDAAIPMASPEELAPMQKRKFERYNAILADERANTEGGSAFWDVVLITAADEEQAEAYRELLKWRFSLGFIPVSPDYHVLRDPPGPKVGNGGATLVALDFLRAQYGADKIDTMRVLLIHAGGYSQRTPQHSVCGKIFAPLPAGPFPGASMLEVQSQPTSARAAPSAPAPSDRRSDRARTSSAVTQAMFRARRCASRCCATSPRGAPLAS